MNALPPDSATRRLPPAPDLPPVPTLRLAPTPSGYLHLGNAVNFVLTAAMAAALDATLFLRVDDLDAGRVRGEYLGDIAETLRWLLPTRADALLNGAVYQSTRVDRYGGVLAGLRQNGLVFACTCSRKDLAAIRSAGDADVNHYPGTCAKRAIDLDTERVVWRMYDSGIVVRQRDGWPSYQLASLTDDVDLGVTHLVRGEDLRASTAMQRVLAKALSADVLTIVPNGWPKYGHFLDVRAWHHALITDGAGRKLSKSAGAESLRALRAAGAGPSLVKAKAGEAIGGGAVTRFAELTSLLKSRIPAIW